MRGGRYAEILDLEQNTIKEKTLRRFYFGKESDFLKLYMGLLHYIRRKFLFCLIFVFTEVQLTYNIVLVSGVQQKNFTFVYILK